MSSVTTISRVLLAAALSLPTTAWADTFQDEWNAGMKALGQARYDAACEHFSNAEQAKGGATIKTRYQLGRCNEEREHWVDAHGYFLDAARLAELEGNPQQAEVARARLADIEKHVPVIILEVPEANRLHGMTIKVGESQVPVQSWGHPIAVEPGTYPVEIAAPGMQTITLQVTAPGAGQRSQVVVPALAAAGPPAVAGPQPIATPMPAPVEGDSGPEMTRKNPALFWTGMGMIIGGGVAALAGVIAYGAATVEIFEDEEDEVPRASNGLWIGAAALVGVGIPFMVVFGKKVPVEGEEGEEAQEAPAEEALRLDAVVSPTGASLRLRF